VLPRNKTVEPNPLIARSSKLGALIAVAIFTPFAISLFGIYRAERATWSPSVVMFTSPPGEVGIPFDWPPLSVRTVSRWQMLSLVYYAPPSAPDYWDGDVRLCMLESGWPLRFVTVCWKEDSRRDREFEKAIFSDFVVHTRAPDAIVGRRSLQFTLSDISEISSLFYVINVIAMFTCGCALYLLCTFAYNKFFYVRAARRRKSGLCRQCAYDLSGSTAAECPECGFVTNADMFK